MGKDKKKTKDKSKKDNPLGASAVNRKARADYDILEKFEAGIVLWGSEVKSLRNGNLIIRDSFAVLRGDEIYLLNCHIGPYKQAGPLGHDPVRSRKLLLHKGEIKRLIGKMQQKGLALIPLKVYFNSRNLVKVSLGLGRGRTQVDKRAVIKKRELNIEVGREMKNRNR